MDSVAEVFKALSSPIRVRLLWMLGVGETCVCDLADELEVTQPTVSFHLKVLTAAGLVCGERRGTWVWYSLIPGRFDQVIGLLSFARDGETSA
ncbi:ArsR/SmtB family transcription factor [Umezawaea endophytica]|uniref:Metalloregulator ArsR/SmtB family transcription factor n=1 Tax=Umezawaea endophytica TaxID=1654476 RepID=A0A9X2VXM8_9PSEU|nr:metalloregulator ArsR/SmtB family transcription factor [Umezawaea endophytica]MCS7484595.1 metalloregulator ArsR/SmtB family transcription factor [Umezawaea endophytica]